MRFTPKRGLSCGKRDLLVWQERPIHMANEAYTDGKRGIHLGQKRPLCVGACVRESMRVRGYTELRPRALALARGSKDTNTHTHTHTDKD